VRLRVTYKEIRQGQIKVLGAPDSPLVGPPKIDDEQKRRITEILDYRHSKFVKNLNFGAAGRFF
jgi:hypothetical protein